MVGYMSRTKDKKRAALFVAAAFLLCLFHWILGWKAPVNQGLGYEGQHYAYLTTHFFEILEKKELGSYWVTRILQPFILRVLFDGLGMEVSVPRIMDGFFYFNCVAVVGTAFLLALLSLELNLSRQSSWLLLASFLGSYSISRDVFAMPVVTDGLALFWGALCLYAYLRSKRILLFTAIAFGSFTWPTFPFVGLPFLLWPRDQVVSKKEKGNFGRLIGGTALFIFTTYVFRAYLLNDRPLASLPTPMLFLLPISFIMFALHIYIPQAFLFRETSIRDVLFSLSKERVLAAGIFVFMIKFIQSGLMGPVVLETDNYFYRVAADTVARPLSALTANIAYYGPCIFLAIFFAKDLRKNLSGLGFGLRCFAALALLQSASCIARQWIVFFPLLLLFSFQAPIVWDRKKAVLFLGATVAVGKFWQLVFIPIEKFLPSTWLLLIPSGQWMGHSSFLFHLVVALLVGLILWCLLKAGAEPGSLSARGNNYKT
jgi:hypothetical protein